MRAITLCLLAACSAPSASSRPVVAHVGAAASIPIDPPASSRSPRVGSTAPADAGTQIALPTEASAPPIAGPPSAAPLTTSGDLDGVAGDEQVTLAADGTLTAGGATITVQIDEADPVFDKQAKIEVVALGGKRRGVLLAMPTSETEDPPNRFRVFVFDHGALRVVLDEVIGAYGSPPVVFSAAGIATYTETGWMACSQMKTAAKAMPQVVTLALDRAGTKIVERSRKPTGHLQDCSKLAG